MKKIEVVISAFKLEEIAEALTEACIQGFTATPVRDYRAENAQRISYRGTSYAIDWSPKAKLEIVVADRDSARVMAILERMRTSGRTGDGDIFLLPCEDTVRIRTGEISVAAL
ncbi:MAG TPA: P-II family nitrogen regulator [Candidatus Baltobacteraceae bacterium]|nr:P-II family nitrogen regulator [Candidatus Baltobacteraceae bacterium]